MKSKILVTVLIGLSLTIASCSRTLSRQIGSVTGDIAQAQSETTSLTTLFSKDGSVQLTVPNTWQEISTGNTEPNLALRVKSQFDKFQIGVQVFPKAEYPQITPELAAAAASDSAKATTGNSGTIQQTALAQINELSAVQYEARGEFAGHQVLTVSTMVESPEAYYNILAVGYAADFATMHDELDQIIQSFQEVQPTTATQGS